MDDKRHWIYQSIIFLFFVGGMFILLIGEYYHSWLKWLGTGIAFFCFWLMATVGFKAMSEE